MSLWRLQSYSKSAVVYASRIDTVNIPASIDAGDTAVLEASVYPNNAQDKTITWSSENPESTTNKDVIWQSDNEDIVKINSNGEFEAIGSGEVTVTAVAASGVKLQIVVNVYSYKDITIGVKRRHY